MDVATILKAFDHLEPQARELIATTPANADSVPEHAAVATVVSIGVSLKRIADALEQGAVRQLAREATN